MFEQDAAGGISQCLPAYPPTHAQAPEVRLHVDPFKHAFGPGVAVQPVAQALAAFGPGRQAPVPLTGFQQGNDPGGQVTWQLCGPTPSVSHWKLPLQVRAGGALGSVPVHVSGHG